jgi:hypothetical protein
MKRSRFWENSFSRKDEQSKQDTESDTFSGRIKH